MISWTKQLNTCYEREHLLKVLMDDERKLHGDLHRGAVSTMAVKETKQSVPDSLAQVNLPAHCLIFTGTTLASIDNLQG